MTAFQNYVNIDTIMKYNRAVLTELKGLPYFDKDVVRELSKKYAVAESSVDTFIAWALRRREFIPLKKGLYVTSSFYKQNASNSSYKFYIANVLRKPSYVSSWSALQYYGLTTESIMSVTSVTTKVTRTYSNKLGGFIYQSIKDDWFSGFDLVGDGFKFAIARPSKALFDLLYFRTNQFRSRARNILESLRIDFDEMERAEKDNFRKLLDETNVKWRI